VAAAQRYVKQFQEVADRFRRIDPDIARTFANGAFMARARRTRRWTMSTGLPRSSRASAATYPLPVWPHEKPCRALDPVAAAKRCIVDYTRIVETLTARGVQIRIARSLAARACAGATPLHTAETLLERFNSVLKHVHATHPAVARTIALSACRSSEPRRVADRYTKNYDAVVRIIRRTVPRRAHSVATQAFRSDKPLVWAKRYLTQLQQSRRVSEQPE
jgi:hypothetical protein